MINICSSYWLKWKGKTRAIMAHFKKAVHTGGSPTQLPEKNVCILNDRPLSVTFLNISSTMDWNRKCYNIEWRQWYASNWTFIVLKSKYIKIVIYFLILYPKWTWFFSYMETNFDLSRSWEANSLNPICYD